MGYLMLILTSYITPYAPHSTKVFAKEFSEYQLFHYTVRQIVLIIPYDNTVP